MSLRSLFLLAVLLSITATISYDIHAQEADSLKGWIINFPSSPLSLSIALEGKSIRLDSRSTGDAVRFRVGCVSQAKEGFSIVEELKSRQVNIPAGLYYGPHTVDLRVTFFPVSEFEGEKKHCEQLKAKVGIIAVEFSDGAIWKAKS